MTSSEKLEAMQEKTKEKLEEKAKKKQEQVESTEEKKEAPKKKAVIKKPVVQEAIGRGKFLPMSMKTSVEVAKAIRGKPVNKAEAILDMAMNHERPIKFNRYKKEVPHRRGKGFGAGRFPVKVSKYIKGVLRNAVANAKYLNLDAGALYIKEISASRALAKERQGSYTNVNITVAEQRESKVKK